MVLRGYVILLVIFSLSLTAQNSKIPKIIEIRQAGGSTQDQEKFPGANILFKTPNKRVKLFHEGCINCIFLNKLSSRRHLISHQH